MKDPSFAEEALRLGGKSDEEARRTGAVDRADDQVESLFAAQRKTSQSPVHQAVWGARVPLELFSPPPAAAPDAIMDRCLEIVRRRRDGGTLLDSRGKISEETLQELAGAGYWGLLIDPAHGGSGVPFARFAPFLTRMAVIDPMVSGLASVHGCIGAVDPVRTFGTPEQKVRLLPRLASGASLSAFALTEPGAGSDLTALKTTATLKGDVYEVTGEKLFITNALPGRTIGLVALVEGKPAVLIADLPPQEDATFRVVTYGLTALRTGHNNGLRFDRFPVPAANLLTPPVGDGLTIAYHGLNLGRIALCAGAAGSMRVMLANLLPWAGFRRTYGQAIQTRELVKRRIARLAGLIAGADALVDWGAWLIDQGFRGELECIVAKIFGSEALKEAAVELFMKTHGGRSFLQGHLFSENVCDWLAPCIYEGEGEMLGMAFFKSLVKEHGKAYFEPIGRVMHRHKMRDFSRLNPVHVWRVRAHIPAYLKWWWGRALLAPQAAELPGLDPRLSGHVDFALERLRRAAWEINDVMIEHRLTLPDRQCVIAEVSQRVQDLVVMLVTALRAHRLQKETAIAAADILCQDLRRRLTGARPDEAYFRHAAALADRIIEGGFEELAGIAPQEILMRY